MGDETIRPGSDDPMAKKDLTVEGATVDQEIEDGEKRKKPVEMIIHFDDLNYLRKKEGSDELEEGEGAAVLRVVEQKNDGLVKEAKDRGEEVKPPLVVTNSDFRSAEELLASLRRRKDFGTEMPSAIIVTDLFFPYETGSGDKTHCQEIAVDYWKSEGLTGEEIDKKLELIERLKQEIEGELSQLDQARREDKEYAIFEKYKSQLSEGDDFSRMLLDPSEEQQAMGIKVAMEASKLGIPYTIVTNDHTGYAPFITEKLVPFLKKIGCARESDIAASARGNTETQTPALFDCKTQEELNAVLKNALVVMISKHYLINKEGGPTGAIVEGVFERLREEAATK